MLRYNSLCSHLFPFFLSFGDSMRMPTPKHKRQSIIGQVLCQVHRRFHSRESNRQPLPWNLGISPPSSGTLGSSRTTVFSPSHDTNVESCTHQVPVNCASCVHLKLWFRVCDGCKSQPYRWLRLQAVINTGVFVRGSYHSFDSQPSFPEAIRPLEHTHLQGQLLSDRQHRGRAHMIKNRVSHSAGGIRLTKLHNGFIRLKLSNHNNNNNNNKGFHIMWRWAGPRQRPLSEVLLRLKKLLSLIHLD